MVLYTHYRGSYCLLYKWIKITIHKTITTQIRPVKLLIPNNKKIGIIHLWIKGCLFNICNLERSISFETTCLAMVQNLPVSRKRICNALRINGGTIKHIFKEIKLSRLLICLFWDTVDKLFVKKIHKSLGEWIKGNDNAHLPNDGNVV